MFTEKSGKQNKLEMVILEELVPHDHLLRKIDSNRVQLHQQDLQHQQIIQLLNLLTAG